MAWNQLTCRHISRPNSEILQTSQPQSAMENELLKKKLAIHMRVHRISVRNMGSLAQRHTTIPS